MPANPTKCPSSHMSRNKPRTQVRPRLGSLRGPAPAPTLKQRCWCSSLTAHERTALSCTAHFSAHSKPAHQNSSCRSHKSFAAHAFTRSLPFPQRDCALATSEPLVVNRVLVEKPSHVALPQSPRRLWSTLNNPRKPANELFSRYHCRSTTNMGLCASPSCAPSSADESNTSTTGLLDPQTNQADRE